MIGPICSLLKTDKQVPFRLELFYEILFTFKSHETKFGFSLNCLNMFVLAELQDEVSREPKYLESDFLNSVRVILNKKFANKVQ